MFLLSMIIAVVVAAITSFILTTTWEKAAIELPANRPTDLPVPTEDVTDGWSGQLHRRTLRLLPCYVRAS